MGDYNRGNRNGDDPKSALSGSQADKLMKIASEKRKLAGDFIKDVYENVPAQYHRHIRLLPQKEQIWSKEFYLNEDQVEAGLVSYSGRTYVEYSRPYVDVEGRITEMIDVHNSHGVGYKLDTYADQIGNAWVIECVFEGLNKKGDAIRVRDRASIGFGGRGVDATNPIENATTSSIGRALAQGGYGNIGSGLTSFEDIYIAFSRQKALKEKNEGDKGHEPNSYKKERTLGQGSSSANGKQERQSERSDERQSFSDNEEGRQEKNPSQIRYDLIGRLIKQTNSMDHAWMKEQVSRWINKPFNGKFNLLNDAELRLVEEHLKRESRRVS